HRHFDRFWRLLHAVETGEAPDPTWLAGLEKEDGIFPGLNAADWAVLQGRCACWLLAEVAGSGLHALGRCTPFTRDCAHGRRGGSCCRR
ncbi:MAG: 1,4-alpha-glucan branching protein domain-containing protein, partial [Cyanobium sp.]